MSEAAGLVVGVIALASLFTTCVDLFEYFESGKNYSYEYELASTKFAILQQRLRDWGKTVNIEGPGREHSSLRHPAKREAIGRSLLVLRKILSDTEGLQKKHNLASTTFAANAYGVHVSPSKAAHWALRLKRRTAWSIFDKTKFDRIIDDIGFLIDNMSKVTEDLGSGDMVNSRCPLHGSGNEVRHRALQRDAINERKMSCICGVGATVGKRLARVAISSDNYGKATSLDGKNANATNASRHDVSGRQEIKKGFGIQGPVGTTDGPWNVHDVVQTIDGSSSGIQGGISKDAWLEYHELMLRYNEKSEGSRPK